MTLIIESPQVYTQLGVAISVTGIAQVCYWSTVCMGSIESLAIAMAILEWVVIKGYIFMGVDENVKHI